MTPTRKRSERLEELGRDYEQGLCGYLADGGEVWLLQAHDLGRRALALRLGVLDLVSIHAKASDSVASPEGFEFLTEAMSPFEMTHRGFAEANARLTELTKSLQLQIEAYEAEHYIAKVLQDAILVPPPEVEGLQVGECYSSSTNQAQVGGDFYDVFVVSGTHICAVIGDVSGKGIEAASVASMTKNTIRVHTLPDRLPRDILHLTNDSMSRFTPSEMFVTVFLALIDVSTGKVRYASAGHPPALDITADGRIRSLDMEEAAGTLLGAFAEATFGDATCTLHPGETLLLYTDGAIETRCHGAMLGDDGFRHLINVEKRFEPQQLVSTAMQDLKAYCGGQLTDDVAMLAVRLAD